MSKSLKKTTVRDIANEAGVSAATVSRVLSRSDYKVSPSLRKKVIQCAEEFGVFIKDTNAPIGNTKIELGMIVPNYSNPYFWQIAMGAESVAYSQGASIYLCNSSRSKSQETKYLQSLFNKGISGVLLSPNSDNHDEIIELQKKGLIVVLLEQSTSPINCGKVLFNYLKASKIAISHLADCGHTKIAFVTAPITQESRQETFLGYKVGLLESGISFQENYVIMSSYQDNFTHEFYEYEIGRECAVKFAKLTPMPTAAFCLNDMIALGFINGLNELGIQVPEDVSVIGLDNIQAAVMSTPSLTTISQPSFEIGKLACKMLIDAIINNSNSDFSFSVEPSLIERHSVKRL